ncbi:hypothetical protein BED35_04545 [Yersinia enterocolitica]|nr:hypothetical protein BB936_04205 [Yersinia enterocolitica]AOF17916.1 hypothetical protein BED34_04095 [Yersinia enterocolitica]AOF22449.1 hypothetical protein BED33_06760 [Yersinia enterocolitica]AOF26159.1 hypothetical protein BED32_04070 [Yersinia enterocolitica]AOF30271.1 hypothetical protein BED35_04545 [Yersinia enterocolitica]
MAIVFSYMFIRELKNRDVEKDQEDKKMTVLSIQILNHAKTFAGYYLNNKKPPKRLIIHLNLEIKSGET